MKRSIHSLIGHSIKAIDGEIGKVREFFYDDETWIVRFLIVKTGNWLTGHKVLISPKSFQTPDRDQQDFKVNLTREQIKNCSEADNGKPLSLQHDIKSYGTHILRSTRKLIGCTLSAIDGAIGKVDDFIVNDRNWKLDFMVVDTGELHPGEKIIISPARIKEINWDSSAVTVNTMVELVKDSPEYNPNLPIGEVYEADLENHYDGFVCHKR